MRGHEAHSSLTPHGVNAVQIACEIVAYIAQRARDFRDDGRPRRRATTCRTRPCTSASSAAAPRSTSCPRDCTFDFEIRHLPFDDPDAFIARRRARSRARFVPDMHAVDARHRHRVRSPVDAARASTPHDGSAITALGHACNEHDGVGKVSFGTEASLFHARRHPDDHLRARPHRAGAPARRMGGARAGRALRSVHAAAGGPSCAAMTRREGSAERCRRSRSSFPTSSAGSSGNTGHRLRLALRVRARRAARDDPGADPRQRSLRRDQQRLAAARATCGRCAAR